MNARNIGLNWVFGWIAVGGLAGVSPSSWAQTTAVVISRTASPTAFRIRNTYRYFESFLRTDETTRVLSSPFTVEYALEFGEAESTLSALPAAPRSSRLRALLEE
jgi:hypothetical protein